MNLLRTYFSYSGDFSGSILQYWLNFTVMAFPSFDKIQRRSACASVNSRFSRRIDGPVGDEFETRGWLSDALSDGEAADGKAPLTCLQAEQLVDGINPSHINLLLGVPDSQREIRIHHPLMHGKLPEACNHPAPVDALTASLGAAPALHAKPDGRGTQKFLREPEIGHAEDEAGVEGAALAGNRAGAAAFTTGETGRHLGALCRLAEGLAALEEVL